jgi:hypothetical protein
MHDQQNQRRQYDADSDHFLYSQYSTRQSNVYDDCLLHGAQ